MSARLNFIRQQGFTDATPQACDLQFSALMWQPRVLLVLVLLGILLETGAYFIALSVVLWWNALLPALNPFDAVYNRFFAARTGTPPLTPAPGPRRFSQAMAATFMLAIGAAMLRGRLELAWTIQVILLLALAALTLGRFCLGSYLYLVLTGKGAYANRTLPWTRGDAS